MKFFIKILYNLFYLKVKCIVCMKYFESINGFFGLLLESDLVFLGIKVNINLIIF